MKKRIISLILAVVMVLGMLPMTVLADETACDHASVTVSADYNGNKTHTTVATCDSCGEAVANDEAAIEVDFVEAAKAMASQDFWAELPNATNNATGATVENVKYITETTDETVLGAWSELLTWIEDNYDWAINDEASGLTGWTKKRLHISANDAYPWGFRLWSNYINEGWDASRITFNVEAAAAGTYSFDISAYNETGSVNLNNSCGGGYVDIYVNGEPIKEDYQFKGNNELVTIEVGDVVLNEGTNAIMLDFVADANGNTTTTTSNTSDRAAVLCGMTFALVGEMTVDCVDEDVDGICDICDANICSHETVTASKVSNGNKTHKVTTVCEDCGAEVANIAGATVADFMATGKELAKQPFWNNMATVSFTDQVPYDVSDIRYVASQASQTDSQKAAYAEMLKWLDENANWGIDEEATEFSTYWANKQLHINGGDAASWGLRMNTAYMNQGNAANYIYLTIDAPVAGTYDLDILAYGEPGSVNIDMSCCGATCDVSVNDKLVMDDVCFAGNNEYLTLSAEDVALNAGKNTILIDILGGKNGAGQAGDHALNLCSISCIPTGAVDLPCADADGDMKCDDCGASICEHDGDVTITKTPGEDKTHTVKAVCSICGEAVANTAAAVKVDMMADLQEAAKQSFWANLPNATLVNTGAENSNVKVITKADAMTEAQNAAYEEFLSWMEDNTNWNLDGSKFNDWYGKRLVLNGSADYNWAVRLYTNHFNEGNLASWAVITVDVPAAGTYDASFELYNENSSINWSNTCGGGIANIYINDVLVRENYKFYASADSVVTLNLGEVKMIAGENTVKIDFLSDRNGATTSADRAAIMRGMTFTPVGEITVACADTNGDGKCEECGNVISSCQHKSTTTTYTVNDDKTHTANIVCDLCGEAIVDSAAAFKVDFVADAQAMAEQPEWASLMDAVATGGITADDVAGIKVMKNGMNETQQAAADSMLLWLDDNSFATV